MTPAPAKTTDNNALEDLGRATLQIVHDLKNQLNGLKLYATFLRKRLDREERSPEERDTLVKLIAGLDRAARDLTALVRFSQPVELHRQPHTDLRDLISGVIKDLPKKLGTNAPLACEIESAPLAGEFDPAVVALERALSLGYRDFKWLARDPDLRKLRKHPGYRQIEDKIRKIRVEVA